MTTAVWVLLGIGVVFVALMVVGCDRLEKRYYQMHPPDDWDGMREDKHDEQP